MSGVFLKRLEWNSVDDITNPVLGLSPMTDITNLTARKGTDVKNNILSVTLKNPNSKYVSTGGVIAFQEEDSLKLYLKLTDDASDIGGTWYDTSNFIGAYFLEEYKHTSTLSKHEIKLTCVDRAYILFNKVFTKTYGVVSSDYWTSPGIMRNVARLNTFTENTHEFSGTDNDAGVFFNTDSRFVSDGGKITDYRSDTSTELNGALSDSDTTITVDSTTGFKTLGTVVIGSEHIYYTGLTGTTFTGCVRAIDDTVAVAASSNATVYQGFPIVDITKVWKPLYEWFQELGTTQFTNYDDETGVGDTLNYSRAFLLWVDKDNGINFFPADQTVDTALTVGSDEIYELSLEKSVFDSVNMVIYNVGEDMYGVGSIWYYFNENSEVSTLKMRYQPMTELIDTLLNKEYVENSGSFPAAGAGDSNRRFPTSYPYTPDFLTDANKWITQIRGDSAETQADDDADFNTFLRYAAFWRGRAESIMITSLLSGLRYRGTITLRGILINPGDLVSVTDSYTGLETQKLRVIDVSQNVSSTQWSTTLTVEEDEQTVQT
jgi:hypothetical protein